VLSSALLTPAPLRTCPHYCPSLVALRCASLHGARETSFGARSRHPLARGAPAGAGATRGHPVGHLPRAARRRGPGRHRGRPVGHRPRRRPRRGRRGIGPRGAAQAGQSRNSGGTPRFRAQIRSAGTPGPGGGPWGQVPHRRTTTLRSSPEDRPWTPQTEEAFGELFTGSQFGDPHRSRKRPISVLLPTLMGLSVHASTSITRLCQALRQDPRQQPQPWPPLRR
jgi:hypothetical protein